MKKSSRYYAVGLWRVWERSKNANDPFTNAPDALVERLAGTFGDEPDDRETESALSGAENKLKQEGCYTHVEAVASIVVGDLGWEAMRGRSPWTENTTCRHGPNSPNLVVLHIYGIRAQSLHSFQGQIWAPATRDPRSFEAIIERARAAAKAAGIPEYETFGPDVPFFVRPQDERQTQRKRVPSRDRDGGTL